LAFLRQAGSYAAAPRPQLVILDIGLPIRDGWQVLAILRATPALATLPVVMLTGVIRLRDEEQRTALQPLACFEKPTQLEEYIGLVAELEKLMMTTPSRE
jgi:chemotaxis family two-component system response regulator Rcp1